MARHPARAVRGFEQLLINVHNLPRSLGNEAYRARTRLDQFVKLAADAAPDKQAFKAALDDLRCITDDMKSMKRSVCREQGKAGSPNHRDYMNFIAAKKQGIALKHFKAK